MNQRTNSVLYEYLGIESPIASKVLIIAVVSGVLAALIDRVATLPTQSLLFAFSELVVVINGPTYALFKKKDDLAGAIMGAVCGLVTLFMWWITAKIVGSSKLFNPADLYNVIKLFLEGALVGLFGFAWFALLHYLPEKFTR